MNKSYRRAILLPLACSMFSSCIYYTPAVPDMPYQGSAGRTTYPDTWVTTQPTGIQQAPIPSPVTSQYIAPANPDAPLDLTRPIVPGTQRLTPAAPIPAPQPKPKVATPKPQPTAPVQTTAVTKPAITTPKPAPKPAVTAKPVVTAQPTSSADSGDMSQITNTGPIPVATRVPGDPTRVYNPLNPSKTIRVVDKNGKPYPSGKELKVRGTNFHFYVP